MAITRTTLTGPVVLPDGTRPVNGTIHFTLSAWDREPGEGLVIPGPKSVQIGPDGDFSVELFRTSSGENSVNYEVAVTHVPAPGEPLRPVIIGNIGLAGPGPFALPDLEIVPSWVPNSVDILAEVNAAAAAVNADRIATETARTGAEAAAATVVGMAMARLPQVFSGATITNPLTLPFSPSSEVLVEVSIDGVRQHAGNFSITDDQLTFVGGWPLGISEVEVVMWGSSSVTAFEFGVVDGGTY